MPSKVISAYRYEPGTRRLWITFVSGRRYVYVDVPPEVYEEMRLSFAKGEYFNRKIRDQYEAEFIN